MSFVSTVKLPVDPLNLIQTRVKFFLPRTPHLRFLKPMYAQSVHPCLSLSLGVTQVFIHVCPLPLGVTPISPSTTWPQRPPVFSLAFPLRGLPACHLAHAPLKGCPKILKEFLCRYLGLLLYNCLLAGTLTLKSVMPSISVSSS